MMGDVRFDQILGELGRGFARVFWRGGIGLGRLWGWFGRGWRAVEWRRRLEGVGSIVLG